VADAVIFIPLSVSLLVRRNYAVLGSAVASFKPKELRLSIGMHYGKAYRALDGFAAKAEPRGDRPFA
jgi:hypothetical protein